MERYRLNNPDAEVIPLPGAKAPPNQKAYKTGRGKGGAGFDRGKADDRINYRGRPKGTPNKLTTNLRQAILLAAEQVGSNNKGQGGLIGYLKRIAKKDEKTYAALLAKIIPQQVTGPNGGPIQLVNLTPELLRVATQDELEILHKVISRAATGQAAPLMIEEQDGPDYEEMLDQDSPVDGHG